MSANRILTVRNLYCLLHFIYIGNNPPSTDMEKEQAKTFTKKLDLAGFLGYEGKP